MLGTFVSVKSLRFQCYTSRQYVMTEDMLCFFLGRKSGLAALLLQRWPHMVVTHCLAHRLELAFKDAVKKTDPKKYERATTLLLGLYYLFRKSPKQKKGKLSIFLPRSIDAGAYCVTRTHLVIIKLQTWITADPGAT